MAGAISIDASTLDPVLIQLGTVSGLLTATNGSVSLNSDFFSDPIGHLEQIPSARSDELAALLKQLLGSSSDSALALPGASANRQWIPLTYTDSSGNVQRTGCHVVIETIAANGHAATSVFGFGVMHQHVVAGLTLSLYAYVPLIADGKFVLAQGAAARSNIELGFVIDAPGAFGTGEFSFDGFRLSADFPLAGAQPQFNAVLINLAVAGAAPADRPFPLDVSSEAIETWITTALALIAGRVKDQTGSNIIAALLAFIGGTGAVPAPNWTAIAGGTMVQAWLLAIATTAGAPQAWLQALACMCGGKALPTTGTPDVTGSGSFLDPYVVPLATVAGATVDFTLAVVPGSDGSVAFTPGLALSSPTVTPVSGVAARLFATVDFVTLTLGGKSVTAPLFP